MCSGGCPAHPPHADRSSVGLWHMAAPSHLPSLQVALATKDRAGSALAPSSCFSPAEENLFSRKGAPQRRCADKGGNVNTLPALASQLSEVANASRANSSCSASRINCGGLKICRDISTSCGPATPHFHSPYTPVCPLHLYPTLPWLPGSFLDHSTTSPHPSRRMKDGGGPPSVLAASASCSDLFCQIKYLCHATLAAVKELLSLISAFLTNFGSWRTTTLRKWRRWKRLRVFQGTPVWGTQHHCLVLWLTSGNKTLLPPMKLVNAAAVCSLTGFCGLGGQPCCDPGGCCRVLGGATGAPCFLSRLSVGSVSPSASAAAAQAAAL